MALRDRLRDRLGKTAHQPAHSTAARKLPRAVTTGDSFQDLKARIHRKLIERLDPDTLENVDKDTLQGQIRPIVESLLTEEGVFLSLDDKERLILEINNETFALGPIEPFMHDPEVADILVNGPGQVYVERFGKLELTGAAFKDDNHLMQIIDRIVSRVGRRIDESSPYVDARLPDGSRVNAIIPPLSLDGPVLSIRRFGVNVLGINDLLRLGTLTPEMGEVLKACVKARLSMLISGGTGSGKTTLLNILSAFIPSDERIVTIEDSAELQLQQPHVVRLETRPPNIEGKGQVTQRDLVRNALRMRPDRILVGEVRGPEVMDMLQAMNTGHEGSLTTLHSNSTRDALTRLETLMLMAGVNIPESAMREMMSTALDVIIQVARLSDGTRKVVSISEIVGMESDVISMQEVFAYQKTGVGDRGAVMGNFRATGVRPRFAERLKVAGISLPAEIFGLARL
jgi:pilus assembly protein CpaF